MSGNTTYTINGSAMIDRDQIFFVILEFRSAKIFARYIPICAFCSGDGLFDEVLGFFACSEEGWVKSFIVLF